MPEQNRYIPEKNGLKEDSLKRGSFTVEAAVIVPFTVGVIALMIGYCYFVHQINWCKGAAYEAALEGIERTKTAEEAQTKAEERMDKRLSEAPVGAGDLTGEASAGSSVEITFEGSVINDYFGDLFDYSGKATVLRVDAVNLKRLEFIVKGLGD